MKQHITVGKAKLIALGRSLAVLRISPATMLAYFADVKLALWFSFM